MLQYFLEQNINTRLNLKTKPTIKYVGKIQPEMSTYPRVMHLHENHVEVVIIYSGSSEYLIGEQKQTVSKGDIIVYNSNVIHDEMSNYKNKIGSYFIAIENLNLANLRENALIPDDLNPVIHVKNDFDSIVSLCESMIQMACNNDQWSEYIIHYSMCALLEIIIHNIDVTKQLKEKPSNYELGKKIKKYIDKNYCEQLTMTKICEDLNLSESYVSHVLKEVVGLSPMQYALKCKIGHAQTLLISTKLPISTIAQTVGFDAQSHFNQRFIKYVGISPSKFRKNYHDM